MSYSRESLKTALQNQVRRLGASLERLDRRSGRLSTIRLLSFLGGMALLYITAKTGLVWLFLLAAAGFAGGFMALVFRHRDTDQAAEKARIWRDIRRTHLHRMDLEWEGIPRRESSDPDPGHPIAKDLNLVGPHSLHHLTDTSIYRGGGERLARWLLAGRPPQEGLARRTALVRELRELPHYRDRLALNAEQARRHRSETDWEMSRLLEHLKHSREVRFLPALALLGGMALLNLLLLALWLAGMADPWVILSFTAYLLAYNFNSGKVRGLFEESYQMEKLLSRFHAILGYLETYRYEEGSELEQFCEPFRAAQDRPSRFLRSMVRLAAAGSMQRSQIGWLILNSLGPWDLWFTWKLEQYKKELRPRLQRWMDRFYSLEALCSLANLAWLNPQYSFALPAEDGPGTAASGSTGGGASTGKENETQSPPPFRAEEIGHPLIPCHQKVTNDVTIGSLGDLLLITGSNMSGKSTFLRTLGINLALCFAGGPVNASRLHTIPFRLYSSINVTDSLDQGLSHFYAEVKRLRRLLEELERPGEPPLFFMVDEIYKGTNNRERMQGSAAFLKTVAGRNSIGLVSTHDLELASLEKEIPSLSNWHFEETIRDGRMSFEYQLKSGPCPTTNALRIMEMEGLPT